MYSPFRLTTIAKLSIWLCDGEGGYENGQVFMISCKIKVHNSTTTRKMMVIRSLADTLRNCELFCCLVGRVVKANYLLLCMHFNFRIHPDFKITNNLSQLDGTTQ